MKSFFHEGELSSQRNRQYSRFYFCLFDYFVNKKFFDLFFQIVCIVAVCNWRYFQFYWRCISKVYEHFDFRNFFLYNYPCKCKYGTFDSI